MRTPKCLLALCLCLIMLLTNFESSFANLEEINTAYPNTKIYTNYFIGLEIDVLPYILGGYFGAITIGRDNVSLRLLTARNATKPDFIIPSEFTNNKLDAYAALIDYRVNPINLRKNYNIWLSAGLVRWNSSIENKQDHAISNYSNTLFSMGITYEYYLGFNFYVSPWVGMHIRVAGESEIQVGNKTYNVPLFNPEASIKFGYNFNFYY
jgi:hypothetical protein